MRPVPEPFCQPRDPFRLGAWIVVPERNQLESEGDSRHLEPKAMEVLLLLVDRAGAVVSKNELIESVWEGRLISEGTLTNTIAELRGALGDDARNPTYIETIPKRGYRLLSSVDEAPPDLQSTAAEAGPARRRRVALIATAAVVVGAVVTMLWLRPRPLEPDLVLVAQFANRTGDSSLDPLTILVRDRIVGELSGSGVARPVAAASGGGAVDLHRLCELARREGAGLALAGGLYLREGEIEVQIKLVDAAEGALLYALPAVTGPRPQVDRVVDEAVQRGLGALATHLTAHAHSSLQSRPPTFEAYREFIAGSELFPGDMEGAIRHLRRAVEIDPDFTSAQMRLAMGLRVIGQDDEGRAILADLNGRRAELTEFERLWLDCFLAEFDGRGADALAALYSILELAPSDWTVLHLIGARELRMNHPRRAIAALEELHAKQLPGFVTRHGMYARSYSYLVMAWHMVGDHAAELAAARAGRERFPTNRNLLLAEGRALAAVGDVRGLEAVAAAAESTSTELTHVRLLVLSSATARAHGREEVSRQLAERSLDVLDGAASDALGPDAGQLRAQALVLTGRLDQAQEVLAELLPQVARERSHRPVRVQGWLGSVAARRGDLDTARAMDEGLAANRDPDLLGSPIYYRAAIAGWLGHREDSIALLRQARAQGWGAYWLLHDEDRVLFEPLEGMAEYQEMLHPED